NSPAKARVAEPMLREFPKAARAIGLQIQVLNTSTSREIEAAFATLVRDRADALFVAPDGFFGSRRVQFATLAAAHRVPAAYSFREDVEAGGLMSYGTDFLDSWHQIGVYTGQILRGCAILRDGLGDSASSGPIREPITPSNGMIRPCSGPARKLL